MFESWPFTNFHDLNLDWIIKTVKDYTKKIDDLFNTGLYDYVESVLSAHPEWTTTVQDGSITLSKLAKSLRLLTVNTYVSPESFGGDPTGEEDSTSALQEAMEFALTNGVGVTIPKGQTYRWDYPIFLPSDTVLVINGELKAGGIEAQFETFDRITPTPGYTASSNVVIKGSGVINMDGQNLTTSGPTPLRIHHSNGVVVKNLTIRDVSKYHAIEIGGSNNVDIYHVHFEGCHENGASVPHEFIQIEDITSGGTSYAIPYDGTVSQNISIHDNKFTTSYHGGKCYTAVGSHSQPTNGRLRNIKIYNNVVEENEDSAFTFLQSVDNVAIENNIALPSVNMGNTESVVYFGHDCHNINIRDNIISDTPGYLVRIGNRAAEAISSDTNTNINITGNNFGSYNNIGVYLQSEVDKCVVQNNVFEDSGALPVHMPSDAATYSENVKLAANVFMDPANMDIGNYQRLNIPTYRTTLYEGTVENPGNITLNRDYRLYDLIEVVIEIPNVRTETKIFDAATLNNEQTIFSSHWSANPATNPLTVINRRLAFRCTGEELIISHNLCYFIQYALSGTSVTSTSLTQEAAGTTANPALPYLKIKAVYGLSYNNTM